MRVLQIGSDRSKRGVLYPGSAGYLRQEAYAKAFGELDIIAFSRASDGARESATEHLRVIPTNSSSRFFYGLDALRVAKKLPRPDVVSAQDPFETGLAAWLIARRFNVPLHVQVHTDLLSPAFARHSLLNWFRVLIAGFVLRRASGIRSVSAPVKKEMEKRYGLGGRIRTLPIYFDIQRFRDATLDASLRERFSSFSAKVLYVGRLEPEKNVRLALKSFAAAAPKDACLIILGDGSERRMLENYARELGIEKRTFFEGLRDPAAYYKLADIVLLTSRYEGYPAVVAEALAAGKPVLSTDVGSARDIGAMTAAPDSFAEALSNWFKNGPRTGELKDYPYRTFEEYVRVYRDDIEACTKTE